ncbi:hypothetical protein [Pseudomonas vanderleydeniana]|uniref:Uncharacterized protein n=1 Tax=Pseudomonas vanderleydeniana TaxID=2745495 RepID=A0A9E6PNG2_9PSED|nr:hypothetical protein [Pseudomonas vanderleydeniana]QXI30022.1 hypothetical protein HU752_008755 [Pseudomonas vanderleydeniana]
MNASSILASLNENSRRYEYELRKFQLELSNAHDQELRLQQEIGRIFPQLAGHQLAGGATISGEVQLVLDQRTQDEAGLRQQLVQVEQGIAAQAEALARMVEELEEAATSLERKLEQDPRYLQQLALHEQAVAQCSDAARSYKELRAECSRKLPAFQTDPFYLYLKARGFGTDGYSSWALWRTLDRWLAKLCNFSENHASERTLLAMQEANEAASWQRDTNRGIQEAELARLQQEILATVDLTTLQKRRQQAQKELDAGKAGANVLHGRLDQFVNRRDPYFAKASELLARQLAEMSNVTLERLAGQTTGTADDRLVLHLRDLRTELDELRVRIPLLEMRCRDATSDYERAKQLERDMQADEHVSNQYSYSEEIDLPKLMSGFMRGGISLDQVQQQVERHRKAAKVVSGETTTRSFSFSFTSSSSSGSKRK